MGNLLTAMNLRMNGVIFSVAAMKASERPEILAKYVDGTLDYYPLVTNPSGDLIDTPSAYERTATRTYRVEALLEHARRQVDPLLPSRFSAVFGVESRKEANAIARQSGRVLSEVFEFELAPSPLSRVARANFEIVGLLRAVLDQAGWSEESIMSIGRAYWEEQGELEVDIPSTVSPTGRKQPRCGVRWEYLIEGRLARVGGGLGWPASSLASGQKGREP
jgi:hypothetical protein